MTILASCYKLSGNNYQFKTFCYFGVLKKLFTTQSRVLKTLVKKALENTVGNGENAGNQHFLLLQQCFLLYQIKQEGQDGPGSLT